MKKNYFLLAALLAFATSWSQVPEKPLQPFVGGAVQNIPLTIGTDHHGQSEIVGHTCKAHELTEQHYQEMGILDDFHQDFQQSIMNSNAEMVQTGMKTPGTNTISVIFHVVYNNPTENVSNALIMQVFNDLTEDFQLLNADAVNARTAFGFVPADANINFCLATQTPAGVPLAEQGVVRVATTETFFDSDNGEENNMKSAPLGSPIWNRNNYLNVWICDISNGAGSGTAGYAYMPSGGFLPSASIDGIVLDYNLGMNNENVLTHEVGHYLGLDHTWGGSGGCTLDDGFADTPQNAGPSFNYAGSCSGNQTTCAGIQTQYENYMDYANCTCMFTAQQANHMLSILTGIRSSLLLSPGCDPTNTPPVANFTADIASPIIIPVNGTVNFDDLSTNVPTGWTWTISGTAGINWNYVGGTSATSQNPSVTFLVAGTYNVTLTASNAYGSDAEVKTGYVQVVPPSAGTACDTLRNYNPVTEGASSYYLGGAAPYSDWGYMPGHGGYDFTTGAGGLYNITHYADRYVSSTSSQVRRIRIPVSQLDDLGAAGFVKVAVHTETTGNPTATPLVTDTMYFADMPPPGYWYDFEFTNPATVTGAFWVSIEMIYAAPQDTVSFYVVDFADRQATTGLNTMKMRVNGTWDTPMNYYGSATLETSLYMDVMLSNGPDPVCDMDYSGQEVCPGGTITANGSGSTNTTNYQWYQTDEPVVTIINESTAGGVTFTFAGPSGDYNIYLFADGSCHTDGLLLPVVVYPAVNAGATITHTSCGYNNGQITVTGATGGDGTYTYSLDGVNFQASNIFSNLPSGAYTIYVKSNGENCEYQFNTTINSSTAFTATVSANQDICPGGTATITAGGGITYNWQNAGVTFSTSASTSVSPPVTTAYNCIVTNSAGCVSNVVTTVYVSPLDDASFDFYDFCDGAPNGPVNIATPGGTFSFNPAPGDGAVINPTTGEITNEVIGTTYTVQYSVNVNCANTSTQTVTVNAQDDPQFTTGNYCSGGTNVVTGIATPGGVFTYNGTDASSINPSTGVITGGVAGTTYLITYTTPAGLCQSVSAPVSVTVGTTPAMAAVGSQAVCQGANFTAINFTGTAGTTYNWTNTNTAIGIGASGSGNIGAFAGTGTTTGGPAATATITVTPVIGTCTGNVQIFTLTVNALPDVDAGPDQTVCTGTPVTLAGSGAVSYIWDNGVTNNVSFTPGIGTVTYTVTGTGSNGCQNTDQVVVTVTDLDDASFTSTDICEGGTNVVTGVVVTGGTFTYDGTDASTIDPATGIITGGIVGTTYNITYTTPLSACQATSAPVAVTVYPNPSVSGTVTNDDGSTNGAIDITITGGTAPYSPVWSHGPTSEDVTGLAPGTYTVTVTDANGCYVQDTYTVISLVGVEDNPLNAALTIYPNPTQGMFNVALAGEFMLNVTDARGRLVLQKSATDKTTVELDSYESGVYFVHVVQGENSIVKKIVKQ
jgi:PKD repeat protein